MRKLIVSMNVTLDGFLSGPNCEMDWHFAYWSSDMGQALCQELGKADSVIMGRVTYTVFSRFASQPQSVLATERDMYPFFDMLNRYQKIVFSKTIHQPLWKNTKLFRANVPETIRRLKELPGENMILYGSAKLLESLQEYDLIDEYQLWVHPIKLGAGKSLFPQEIRKEKLKIRKCKYFNEGVVLKYMKVIHQESEIGR